MKWMDKENPIKRESSNFEKSLKKKAYNHKIPAFGKISITYQCNFDCVHCYCNLPHAMKAVDNELSKRAWIKIFDEMAEAGCLWLTFTGGEPLIRRDFAELYTAAYNRGFFISVFSNGSLIDEDHIKLFQSFPPRQIEISLYGITAETCEKVTRQKKSFDQCMLGIQRLRKAGIRFSLKTPALILNKHEIEGILSFADEMKIDMEILPAIYARMDGDPKPLQYRLPPEEVARYLLLKNRKKRIVSDFDEIKERQKRNLNQCTSFFCESGHSEFHIDPYGRIGFCPLLSHPSYTFDLTHSRFLDGWAHLKDLEAEISKGSSCADKKSDLSFQCPIKSFNENANFSEKVEYLDDFRDALLNEIESAGGGR